MLSGYCSLLTQLKSETVAAGVVNASAEATTCCMAVTLLPLELIGSLRRTERDHRILALYCVQIGYVSNDWHACTASSRRVHDFMGTPPPDRAPRCCKPHTDCFQQQDANPNIKTSRQAKSGFDQVCKKSP